MKQLKMKKKISMILGFLLLGNTLSLVTTSFSIAEESQCSCSVDSIESGKTQLDIKQKDLKTLKSSITDLEARLAVVKNVTKREEIQKKIDSRQGLVLKLNCEIECIKNQLRNIDSN